MPTTTFRRVALLLGPLLLLWAMAAELNHHLAPRQVWVFTGGLHVGFIALTQAFGPGLAAVLLSGLACDSATPVPFGTHALLFGLAHNVVFRMRDRIPKDDPVALTLVALFANFGLFLAFAASRGTAEASRWTRLGPDLVASQVLVAVVTPWFTALQARLIDLVETALELRAGRLR